MTPRRGLHRSLAAALLTLSSLSAALAAPSLLTPSWTVTDLVKEMRASWLGGTVKAEQATGQTREFNLHIEEINQTLTEGVVVKAWAFGLEGKPATVPGPLLRVRAGDRVVIHLRNNTTQPHSLHPHGITSVDMLNDGVPHITGAYVLPGQTMTYSFVASEAGTHWYHCHVQTSLHQTMGMYGALVVEDRAPATWDREFVQMLGEWDTHRDPAKPTVKPNFNYFLVNGHAGNSVPDMDIPKDKIARVRLINAGFESHSLHLHGTHFLITHKDGYPLPAPVSADTINVAPGETYDVFVKGRDGVWPWHDHNSLAVTDDGVYPGGMIMHAHGTGNDAFDPAQQATHLPLEGGIHAEEHHTGLDHGDPQFLLERLTALSPQLQNASGTARPALQAQIDDLKQASGATLDAKTGTWTLPTP